VLDASALLALLLDEPGGDVVGSAVEAGALISTVNYSEVLARLIRDGMAPAEAANVVTEATGGGLRVVPFSQSDAIRAAALRRPSRRLGLSLADRACLALAARLDRRALTADRGWTRLTIFGVPVTLIR
jgi:PIN domain nuclease of toxin-antitoxin system